MKDEYGIYNAYHYDLWGNDKDGYEVNDIYLLEKDIVIMDELLSYPAEVFDRVKSGVKRADYEYEFNNGAYGGSLFCFVFKTDIENLLDIKKQMDGAEYINIPTGTQFGFFSSFQGAGSIFEKRTYRNMKVKIKGDTEYDTVDIIADMEQSYSMDDVYGGINVDDQNITLA